jgi:hypothetical protein
MKKSTFIIISWIFILSCHAQIGPGYSFRLFDGTPNESLAKAVASEDTTQIKKLISKGDLNINFQESKFGNTVLLLAIGNSKLKSVQKLLELKADVNIQDYNGVDAINEASQYFLHPKHSCEILKLLLDHGADVNSIKKSNSEADANNLSVPLSDAVENFEISKLLLDHGANPNIEKNNSFTVWMSLLSEFSKDQIYVAHYIIVEKKMLVPNPIFIEANQKEITIFDFLNSDDFPKDARKVKAKQDILEYLHKINFPVNGRLKN